MISNNRIDEMIKSGCLLTSGPIENFNTMAIGWGMIGTIWRKKTFIVYVKPCRYTYEFMENNDYWCEGKLLCTKVSPRAPFQKT